MLNRIHSSCWETSSMNGIVQQSLVTAASGKFLQYQSPRRSVSQHVTCLLFQVQEKLLLSACHLLVSLATTVRPVFLISIPAVQKVFNSIIDASAQRLANKVGHTLWGIPGVLWLRPGEAKAEETGSAFTFELKATSATWTASVGSTDTTHWLLSLTARIRIQMGKLLPVHAQRHHLPPIESPCALLGSGQPGLCSRFEMLPGRLRLLRSRKMVRWVDLQAGSQQPECESMVVRVSL